MSVKNLRSLFRYTLRVPSFSSANFEPGSQKSSAWEKRKVVLKTRLEASRSEQGNRGPGLFERMRASLAEARQRAVEFVRSTRNKLDDAALEAYLSMFDPEVRQLTLEALKDEAANIGNQAAEGTKKAAQELNRRFQAHFLGPVREKLRPIQAFAKRQVESLIDVYRSDRANSKNFWAGLAERGAAGLTELVSKLQEYAANQRGGAEALRRKAENNRATRAAIANVASSNTTSS